MQIAHANRSAPSMQSDSYNYAATHARQPGRTADAANSKEANQPPEADSETVGNLEDITAQLSSMLQNILKQLMQMFQAFSGKSSTAQPPPPPKSAEGKQADKRHPQQSKTPSPAPGNAASPQTNTAASNGGGYTPFAGNPFQDNASFLKHMEQMLLRPAPARQPGDPVYDLMNGKGSTEKDTEYDVNAAPPTAREMEQLTEKYNLEFALSYVKDRGIILTVGANDRVNMAGNKKNSIKIVHTHPGGAPSSQGDRDNLKKYSQQTSFIVRPAPGEQFGSLSTYSDNQRELNNVPI